MIRAIHSCFLIESPWLSAVLILILGSIFTVNFLNLLSNIFYKLPIYLSRHKHIRIHGYPPKHCDADGDFKEHKEEENNGS